MGQRLTISIVTGDQPMLALYQHWGGYTDSTLEEIKDIRNVLMTVKNYTKKAILTAILNKTKYNAAEDQVQAIKDIVGDKAEVFEGNRNNGIIYVTDGDVGRTIDIADVHVEFDIDAMTITCYGLFNERSIEDFMESQDDNECVRIWTTRKYFDTTCWNFRDREDFEGWLCDMDDVGESYDQPSYSRGMVLWKIR